MPSEDKFESLRSLYPDYSDAELREAYDNLRRYFELGWRIFTRLQKERKIGAFDKEQPNSYDVLKVDSHPTINSLQQM